VSYLVSGLKVLSESTKDSKYIDEARRNADYAFEYTRDDGSSRGDGTCSDARGGSNCLYWRNCRLWRINQATDTAFTHMSDGQIFPLQADDSERSRSAAALKLPVEKRPMTKTLLANAGAARTFWLLAAAGTPT
jgi:hypothetical protein